MSKDKVLCIKSKGLELFIFGGGATLITFLTNLNIYIKLIVSSLVWYLVFININKKMCFYNESVEVENLFSRRSIKIGDIKSVRIIVTIKSPSPMILIKTSTKTHSITLNNINSEIGVSIFEWALDRGLKCDAGSSSTSNYWLDQAKNKN